MSNEQAEYDYIVVGSGPGGAPLACNLARAGQKVLLIEAGGDKEPYNYQVPVYHTRASEDDELKWDFFVRHYESEELQKKDSKYVAEKKGVLYPRCGTLGGCSAHNAMITVYPHNSDWNYISQLMKDQSWNAENMRKYFQRIENCHHRPFQRFLYKLFRINPSRHGYNGWYHSNMASPTLVLGDTPILTMLFGAITETLQDKVGNPLRRLKRLLDPNDWSFVNERREGLSGAPIFTNNGKRGSTRDYIRETLQKYPNNLHLKMHTLVSKVILDDDNKAIGVEVLEGEKLYRAHGKPNPDANAGTKGEIYVKKEVILSGGAYNSPQLLKLSGIGPKAELENHGVPVRVDLPGVGENMQDRYEVGIVSEMKEDFEILKDASFNSPDDGVPADPEFKEWEKGEGLYATNGAVLAIIKRSKEENLNPDLFIFGLPALFKGYFPGYSNALTEYKKYFTWAILKGHTNNTAGSVTLKSSDPKDTPHISFRYFDEGNDPKGDDLESVVEAVEFVRDILKRSDDVIKEETVPGKSVQNRDEVRQFVKDEAWGHHASCTNKMGLREDKMAVLDSNFKVYGTKNLRVVDASVFPKIPGFFIVSAVYMISEKATDVILADS